MSVTKDSSIVFPSNRKGRYWLWNEASTWDVDSNTIVVVPRTRTGDRLPKWRSIIESGGNATTGLTAVLCSLDYDRLHGTFEQWTYMNIPAQFGRRENDGDTFIRNNVNPIDFTNASVWSFLSDGSFTDNLARAAFYKKLKLLETQFQGYIFAGELMETLKMLRHPLVGIRSLSKDFLDTLRKRKRANPKKWLNDIGSAWLEQSFGWNPLLNDVSDAVKAYQRLVKPVQTQKLSASASKTYDRTRDRSTVYWPGYQATYDSGCTFHTVSSWFLENVKIRYKGALIARVKAPSWQNKDLFGFEPQNFIPAAWELLPWSFLADYFANIGDILDASIVSTRNLAWVNKSVVKTIYKHGLFRQVWGAAPGGSGWTKQAMSGSQGHHFAKQKSVVRSANVGMSMPTLQFNFDLTGGQLANIDALLSQANALHPQHNPRHWHR
jgi:hypothetical protein